MSNTLLVRPVHKKLPGAIFTSDILPYGFQLSLWLLWIVPDNPFTTEGSPEGCLQGMQAIKKPFSEGLRIIGLTGLLQQHCLGR